MGYQLTDTTITRRVTEPGFGLRSAGGVSVNPGPNVGAHLPGAPLPSGQARYTGNWPSGWWILPSVLGGLMVWIMIFRALIGWLF